jgi:Protein involved in formate dehydrogenase formation
MIGAVSEAGRPGRGARAETREVTELRALKDRQPELADAVDMHVELIEHVRRIQSRIPLPWFELNSELLAKHQAEARPILRFENIPLELTDLRLLVRQTADVLRRHGALDDADYAEIQNIGRDMKLLAHAGEWYRRTAERHVAAPAALGGVSGADHAPTGGSMLDQVLSIAMRPFLSRCAEVLQRADLSGWTHGFCPLCGGEPDLAVITPAAERHLICGRCSLHWKFESLTCPFCNNSDRSRITSFATPDGQYRVYACDVCQRYLKAYDARRASRPVMHIVDSVATLPLDAAAMQRGYTA